MTYAEVHELVEVICTKIGDKNYTGVYGIPRGGLVPAALIAYRLNIPLAGFGNINKNVLVVDDGINTGATISNDVYSFCDKAVLTLNISLFKAYYLAKVARPIYVGKEITDYVTYPWET